MGGENVPRTDVRSGTVCGLRCGVAALLADAKTIRGGKAAVPLPGVPRRAGVAGRVHAVRGLAASGPPDAHPIRGVLWRARGLRPRWTTFRQVISASGRSN